MNSLTARIRALNDTLRATGEGGHLMITDGIAGLQADVLFKVLLAVQTFDDFDPDNDPYGEHDCALIIVAEMKVVFKIDYYDRSMTRGSSDPANVDQTCRVLTIMFADEY